MRRRIKWTLVRYAAGAGQNCQSSHQSSFSANCTCRAVVHVLVIAPAVPDNPVVLVAVGGVNTMRFGVLKSARFSRLKISARNCTFRLSRSHVLFSTEKSQVARPGPSISAHVAVNLTGSLLK